MCWCAATSREFRTVVRFSPYKYTKRHFMRKKIPMPLLNDPPSESPTYPLDSFGSCSEATR